MPTPASVQRHTHTPTPHETLPAIVMRLSGLNVIQLPDGKGAPVTRDLVGEAALRASGGGVITIRRPSERQTGLLDTPRSRQPLCNEYQGARQAGGEYQDSIYDGGSAP